LKLVGMCSIIFMYLYKHPDYKGKASAHNHQEHLTHKILTDAEEIVSNIVDIGRHGNGATIYLNAKVTQKLREAQSQFKLIVNSCSNPVLEEVGLAFNILAKQVDMFLFPPGRPQLLNNENVHKTIDFAILELSIIIRQNMGSYIFVLPIPKDTVRKTMEIIKYRSMQNSCQKPRPYLQEYRYFIE
jgi:hypothetical protein